MRFVWLVFVGLVVALVAIVPRMSRRAATSRTPAAASFRFAQPASLRTASPKVIAGGQADSVVAFGLAQRGTPYVYAGTSPLTGFDCSGFILYTFAHFGVPVPHSTALLIDVGRPVARAEAQPGDIVVFTGTATTSTTPGHAGIVISRRGEVPLRFVHASSSRREPFVKVSQVENSDYERRFMQVRRVLGPGTGVMAKARPSLPAAASTPAVAPLATRRVAVRAGLMPAAPLPQKLATKKYLRHSTTASKKKPIGVKKKAAKAKRKTKASAKLHTAPKKRPPSFRKPTAKKR
jgi:hypothetical protein